MRWQVAQWSKANVGHLDARLQTLRQTEHKRQDRVNHRGVVDSGAVFGHQPLEAWIGRVPYTSAVAETFDEGLFYLREQGNVLGSVMITSPLDRCPDDTGAVRTPVIPTFHRDINATVGLTL